jgi:hypothetical protein
MHDRHSLSVYKPAQCESRCGVSSKQIRGSPSHLRLLALAAVAGRPGVGLGFARMGKVSGGYSRLQFPEEPVFAIVPMAVLS